MYLYRFLILHLEWSDCTNQMYIISVSIIPTYPCIKSTAPKDVDNPWSQLCINKDGCKVMRWSSVKSLHEISLSKKSVITLEFCCRYSGFWNSFFFFFSNLRIYFALMPLQLSSIKHMEFNKRNPRWSKQMEVQSS